MNIFFFLILFCYFFQDIDDNDIFEFGRRFVMYWYDFYWKLFCKFFDDDRVPPWEANIEKLQVMCRPYFCKSSITAKHEKIHHSILYLKSFWILKNHQPQKKVPTQHWKIFNFSKKFWTSTDKIKTIKKNQIRPIPLKRKFKNLFKNIKNKQIKSSTKKIFQK